MDDSFFIRQKEILRTKQDANNIALSKKETELTNVDKEVSEQNDFEIKDSTISKAADIIKNEVTLLNKNKDSIDQMVKFMDEFKDIHSCLQEQFYKEVESCNDENETIKEQYSKLNSLLDDVFKRDINKSHEIATLVVAAIKVSESLSNLLQEISLINPNKSTTDLIDCMKAERGFYGRFIKFFFGEHTTKTIGFFRDKLNKSLLPNDSLSDDDIGFNLNPNSNSKVKTIKQV